MKNYYKAILGTILMVFIIITNGCKKFVQIGPSKSLITTTGVFNNSGSATAAQLAIYSNMWSPTFGEITFPSALLSDELVNTSSTSYYIQYYTNSMDAVTTNNLAWKAGYSCIYAANANMEQLQNNPNITAGISKQLTGEAKFVRAYWHFQLANMFGDVPLVTTTDYTINRSIARTAQSVVYDQVITDLKDAENLLNNSYVDASDTISTTERARPNKGAAQALLARVYLYTKKYNVAEAEATAVINNPLYSLCPNLSGPSNSVFLKNSNEAIWQLAPSTPISYFTPDGYSLYLKAIPGSGTVNCSYISNYLLNAFEAGDKRKTQWIGLYTGPNNTQYYFPYKYQSRDASATNLSGVTEYEMVLRLAEQYLIRAEARAQQNNLPGAIDDLNKIRQRAGLSGLSAAGMTQQQVLTAILHERQVELFTEEGHRWFDLQRTGNLDAVMGSPGNVYNVKGGTGTWSPQRHLFPIPQTELIADPNLTQNPGY